MIFKDEKDVGCFLRGMFALPSLLMIEGGLDDAFRFGDAYPAALNSACARMTVVLQTFPCARMA